MSTEPKYLHPSVTSRIIDNAVLTLSAAGLSNQFICLEAEKGAPRKATYVTTTSQYQFNFGDPNYSKYGQSGLNAIQWLRAGGGLWVIRVVPDDETYAEISIGVGYNASQQYTNDAEEYQKLSLTANQIKLWNTKNANNTAALYAKGSPTGSSVNMPKFYAVDKLANAAYIQNNDDGTFKSITGGFSPNTSLGMMTEDAISIYNNDSGYTEDANKNTFYVPVACRKVSRKTLAVQTKSIYYNGTTVQPTDPTVVANAKTAIVKFNASASSTSGMTINPLIYVAFYTETTESGVTNKVMSNNNTVITFASEAAAKTYYAANKPSSGASETCEVYFIEASFTIDVSVAGSFSVALTTLDTQCKDLGLITAYITEVSNSDVNTHYYTTDTKATKAVSDALKALSSYKGNISNVDFIEYTASSFWDLCYEVYSENGARPLIASYANSNPAMTELEITDYNLLHKGSLPVLVSGKDLKNKSNAFYVNANPSTGVVSKDKTYYVSYSADGSDVKATLMTEDAINQFNYGITDSDSMITKGSDSSSDVNTLSSQHKNWEAIVNSTAKFSESTTLKDNADIAKFHAVDAAGLSVLFTYTRGVATVSTGLTETTVNFDPAMKISEYLVERSTDIQALLSAGYIVKIDGTYSFAATMTADVYAAFKKLYTTAFAEVMYTTADFTTYTLSTTKLSMTLSLPTLASKLMVASDGIADVTLSTASNITDSIHVCNVATTVTSSSVDNKNYVLAFVISYYCTKNKNVLLALDDTTITFASSSITEFIPVTEYTVTYKDDSAAPNPDYVEKHYQSIGLSYTSYTKHTFQDGTGKGGTYYEVAEKPSTDFQGFDVDATHSEIATEDKANFKLVATRWTEFLRFVPKGSGKWYNNLAVSLSYDNSFDSTYPDWSMFKLEIIENYEGSEIVRETFNVSLDPDAISGAKESLFIESVVNRYSSYLDCYTNYDNLTNFIETKLAIKDDEGNAIKDSDGNEIVPSVDTIVKYIFNQIDLAEVNSRTFGDDTAYEEYYYTDLYSAIGYDSDTCALDKTVRISGTKVYSEPFLSQYYMNTVTSNGVMYLGGGSYGNGWGYEYTNDNDELVTTSTLEQALIKGYNGTYDPFITNILLSEFDIVMDCNYSVAVKNAMSELSSITRQDCFTILDTGLDCANATQAIDKRKASMSFDTYFTMIFTQHIVINDEWSGKPVKVTPTFYLASKIPQNDSAYGVATNFVGPRRGIISNFTSISWLPTEPEKTELYKKQLNYIETDNVSTQFATELTSQTRNTPMSMAHAVRSLLKVKREMERASRNYRSEFATTDVYGQLQLELNNIASKWVLGGGFQYINPVINTSTYDRQQRICRVNVDVAFTDIIERFVFDFVVNRA